MNEASQRIHVQQIRYECCQAVTRDGAIVDAETELLCEGRPAAEEMSAGTGEKHVDGSCVI